MKKIRTQHIMKLRARKYKNMEAKDERKSHELGLWV